MPKRAKDNSPPEKHEPAIDPNSKVDQNDGGYYYDDTHGYEPFEAGDEDDPQPPAKSDDEKECE